MWLSGSSPNTKVPALVLRPRLKGNDDYGGRRDRSIYKTSQHFNANEILFFCASSLCLAPVVPLVFIVAAHIRSYLPAEIHSSFL